jgi:hypothetical protein
MSRRPANITQADIARAIRAAKQAGAMEVEIRVGDCSVIVIRLGSCTDERVPLEQNQEIIL